MKHRRVFAYTFTAVFAALWGVIGRLVLDSVLAWLGFDTNVNPPMLTWAVGPSALWAAIAIALWTPLTPSLAHSTAWRAAWLGVGVAGAGIVVLFVIFLLRVDGVPSTVSEVWGAFVSFPVFLASAVAFGGFIAIPATIATAVLLRSILQQLESSMPKRYAA